MSAGMTRVQAIWQHPLYQKHLNALTRLESDRIFCRHTPEHFLDVARLAYIFALERNLDCSRELIYCTALLHDILDPGVGFGKTYEMNLETMDHLELFQHLGFPVLLGTSRKSMIGLTLDLPVGQRVEGTIATSVIGVMKGCAFVRVHDVKENRRAVLMTEAILGRNIK